jgi:hypothetical protein
MAAIGGDGGYLAMPTLGKVRYEVTLDAVSECLRVGWATPAVTIKLRAE